jgi:uncharacterized protein YbjT (DUF2867 family)
VSEDAQSFETRPVKLTVCVLGGTGFVGSELIVQLAKQGHWVRVPTRETARGDRLRVMDTVRIIRANVRDPGTLARLFTGADVVVNLIGILNENSRATFKAVHADFAAKVVSAARAAGVKRLLHMSSLGADAKSAPSRYLRSKGEAEARIRESGSSLEWTVFRPSVIFGAADSLTNRFARLLRLSGGFMPLARASARFAPVYVGDVVAAFLCALRDRTTIGQTFELCGPDVMTLEQVVHITASVARLPCRIVRLPDFIARLEGIVMGLLPGKPFSLDNYRSLTIDSVCREDGFARLKIQPQPMLGILPTYLQPDSIEDQLGSLRRSNDL